MITVECKDSVLSPDAGHVTTFLITKESLSLPFTDKSIAVGFETLPYGIGLTYRDGYRVIVPYGNVRYILSAPEAKNKKEAPHTISPNKK